VLCEFCYGTKGPNRPLTSQLRERRLTAISPIKKRGCVEVGVCGCVGGGEMHALCRTHAYVCVAEGDQAYARLDSVKRICAHFVIDT